MAKTFTKGDVASHNKGDNLWVIIDEDVYDLTKFQDEHPGACSIAAEDVWWINHMLTSICDNQAERRVCNKPPMSIAESRI